MAKIKNMQTRSEMECKCVPFVLYGSFSTCTNQHRCHFPVNVICERQQAVKETIIISALLTSLQTTGSPHLSVSFFTRLSLQVACIQRTASSQLEFREVTPEVPGAVFLNKTSYFMYWVLLFYAKNHKPSLVDLWSWIRLDLLCFQYHPLWTRPRLELNQSWGWKWSLTDWYGLPEFCSILSLLCTVFVPGKSSLFLSYNIL